MFVLCLELVKNDTFEDFPAEYANPGNPETLPVRFAVLMIYVHDQIKKISDSYFNSNSGATKAILAVVSLVNSVKKFSVFISLTEPSNLYMHSSFSPVQDLLEA